MFICISLHCNVKEYFIRRFGDFHNLEKKKYLKSMLSSLLQGYKDFLNNGLHKFFFSCSEQQLDLVILQTF